jgi:hypothetical protein
VDDDRWDEQVGSVAEEAQRLLESLRRTGGPSDGTPPGGGPRSDGSTGSGAHDRAARSEGGPAGSATEDGSDDDPGDGEDTAWVCTDPFCRSCPLCRTVAVVRELSPETLRRLADLATVAAGVLSDLAGERDAGERDERDRGSGSDDGPRADSARPGRPGRPRPTRAAGASPIPVRDADEESGGA